MCSKYKNNVKVTTIPQDLIPFGIADNEKKSRKLKKAQLKPEKFFFPYHFANFDILIKFYPILPNMGWGM